MSHPVARQSAQEGLQGKPQTARAGNTACKVFTNHETRDPSHESRDTNHGFSGRSVRRGCASVAPPKSAARTAAPAGSVNGPWPSMAVHDTEYPTKMHKIPDPAEKSLLAGSLLSPMARRCSVGGGEPVSAHGQCFSTRLTTSAVRWKSHKNAQNPGSRRKMREARPSPQLPSPCAPLPLRRMPNEPVL